ncbi:hypothetical protein [Streptomyces capitiformicae]|uniref:Tetratricopeptide repeat protein n=1 Tax=Streptomyces capitiformicae TaxID=2014920 RepID=A0A918Z630_9ACTN|nr:hypothetical protein [Streptomyces capitiformicae]GHE38163.1 hypothetical protein GCM10017771_56670 [Streptomyces capitiformicae]
MGENSVSGGRQGQVVQTGSIQHLTLNSLAEAPAVLPRYLQNADRWPLAGAWNALAAGAHRARPGEDGTELPPYVRRDVDDELRDRVRTAAERGGLVLVLGDSTAGKTRATFEAVRHVLPGHRVIVPPSRSAHPGRAPDAVERAGVPCLVWLDDLERHLGPDGLEADVLDELVALGVPVIATMRRKEYTKFYAPGDGDGGGHPLADLGDRVLRRAAVIELDRLWSTAELERAGACDDSRIADAVAHHGPHGIAEYLAAGPVLLRDWRQARTSIGHARGAALVATAVDLARTGLRGPYPRELLAELHEHHLSAAGGAVLRPEPLEAAFEWAAHVRYGVTSLLMPGDGDRWKAFDYLLDHSGTPVADPVWEAALAHAAGDTDKVLISLSAIGSAPHISWRAISSLSIVGLGEAVHALMFAMARCGETKDAEDLFRDSDHVIRPFLADRFAAKLLREDLADEPEPWLRETAGTSSPEETAVALARTLVGRGAHDEALALLRGALQAGAGHRAAACEMAQVLGASLVQDGRVDDAEALFRHLFDTGFGGKVMQLGAVLALHGRLDDLIEVEPTIDFDTGQSGVVVRVVKHMPPPPDRTPLA